MIQDFDPFDDQKSVDNSVREEHDYAEEGSSGDDHTPEKIYKIGLARKKINCPIHSTLEEKHFQVLKRFFSKNILMMFVLTPLGDKCFIRAKMEKRTHYDIELVSSEHKSSIPSSYRNGVISMLPVAACGVVLMDGHCMEIHQKTTKPESGKNKFSVVTVKAEKTSNYWSSHLMYDFSLVKGSNETSADDSIVIRETNGFSSGLLDEGIKLNHKLVEDIKKTTNALVNTVANFSSVSIDSIEQVVNNTRYKQEQIRDEYKNILSVSLNIDDGNGNSVTSPRTRTNFYKNIKEGSSMMNNVESINAILMLTRDMVAEIDSVSNHLNEITDMMNGS